ncbi:MAG TPA: TonB family protein [Candidatus Eremiobacteraceae bacterium]|nr:TonB family protein [Candidatus Eremiobacteraceae bacterium]
MSNINPQQPLRRTLKPRDGGGPGAPLALVATVAGVLVVGGGIAYAVTVGHHGSAAPAPQASAIAYQPLPAQLSDVTAVTHAAKPKKPAKHGATPTATATPGATPTPAATPTTAATTNPLTQKVAVKHAVHHVKSVSSSSLAFEPNAATQSSSITPVSNTVPATLPPSTSSAPAPTPTPDATPIYEPAVVVEARFISQIQPIYPEIAKQQGIQGTAIILATVGPHGNVIDETVGQSTGNRLLDAAALDAARASKFEAPEVDGHPATETYRIVYTFALNN